MMERDDFLNLIHASYVVGRFDFSRLVAADWLASWPEDIEVKLLLAEAEIKDGLFASAIRRLEELINFDPELLEAYELLAAANTESGDSNRAHVVDACRALLQGEKLSREHVPSWIRSLDRANQAMDKGNNKKAIREAQKALEADPDLALPSLLAVKAHLSDGRKDEAISLASSGHDRWPECIFFRILIAENMIEIGELNRGVETLHKVASDDPTGRVAKKYLGVEHPYKRLWPVHLSAQMRRPIPSDVRAIFGGNRIASQSSYVPAPEIGVAPARFEKPISAHVDEQGKRAEIAAKERSTSAQSQNIDSVHANQVLTEEKGVASEEEATSEKATILEHMPTKESDSPDTVSKEDLKPDTEFVRSIEHEFEQIAARLKVRQPKTREVVRQPVYVIISCMQPLITRFGRSKFERLDEAIRSLVSSIQNKPGWNAIWLYVDDPDSMAAFQLTPADPRNAWEIKLKIADLDRKLQEQDEMIGALFIIGGDEIVPFHMLPNPTDDDDDAVPSDNPYSTSDENYFAPEWLVGRLPSDDEMDLLVRYIRSAAEEHRSGHRIAQPINRFVAWILKVLSRIFRRKSNALGYSANIWRKASLAVYRAIGNPGSLVTSPPAHVGSLPSQLINPVSLSYYNLHGLEDAPEWFGQRDPFEDAESISPDFPIALRPEDIVNGGRAPQIVFTEACFGANVLGKTSDTAISLKFLDSGSKALVGSTKISYGSVTPPLIAADLLGRYFWEGYTDGYPVGEALRRAKLQLATEMHRRQGYLDGEDQKTLISFVLFGDPLWTSMELKGRTSEKSITRKSSRPAKMKTACALGGPSLDPDEIEPVMMSKVRSIVADYLPGMADATCRINPQHQGCNGIGHVCPTHQLKFRKEAASGDTTVVVSFSKHISVGETRHPHYARLTFDKYGKVLKLAVSR